jgi:alkylation response protein AidB-like acyl-CoA dehydrogenase
LLQLGRLHLRLGRGDRAEHQPHLAAQQSGAIVRAMGVVSGVPVERLYRQIRAPRIYEGTTGIRKLIIAGQLPQG